VSNILSFTPPRSAPTDSRGNLSRDWQLFFDGLYRRLGQANAPSIPELAAEVAAIDVDLAAINASIAALNAAMLAMRLPVGAIHVSVDPTNPATTLGYGTWAAFGTGRVIVGVDVGDTDFDNVMETGGSKTATI
jgi:hypothetical protein